MKKTSILTIVFIFVVGFAGIGIYTNSQDSNDSAKTTETEIHKDSQNTHDHSENKITISEDGKTISYYGVEGETALVTLKELTTVQTEESSFGEFVTSINGYAADSSTEFWSFYVNGELASVGAGSYDSKDGDKIEWKVEKLN